ncbi:hypothetical protein D3C71_2206440 [compost metagenome]
MHAEHGIFKLIFIGVQGYINRTAQVCFLEVGLFKMSHAQVTIPEYGAFKISPGKVGLCQ